MCILTICRPKGTLTIPAHMDSVAHLLSSSLNCSPPHLSVLVFVWSVNDNKLHHLLGAFIYKAFKHRSAQL